MCRNINKIFIWIKSNFFPVHGFRLVKDLGEIQGWRISIRAPFFIVMRWLIDRGVITTPHAITLSLEIRVRLTWPHNSVFSTLCGAIWTLKAVRVRPAVLVFVNTLPLEFSSQNFTQISLSCIFLFFFSFFFFSWFIPKKEKDISSLFFLWVRSKYFWLVH